MSDPWAHEEGDAEARERVRWGDAPEPPPVGAVDLIPWIVALAASLAAVVVLFLVWSAIHSDPVSENSTAILSLAWSFA